MEGPPGGQSFTAAEVITAGQVAIELVVLVESLVVGGLTFISMLIRAKRKSRVIWAVVLFLPLAPAITLLSRVLWIYLDQTFDSERISW